MPIDIAALATTVVTSLVPYAKARLEKIAQAAKYASDLTGQVWEAITAAFASPKEQTVLELFQDDPEEMQGILIKKLQEKLEQDSQLAQTLSDLINKLGPDGASTGAQIMNADIAGIADLREADLSRAKKVSVAGVNIGGKPTPSADA